jgi:hypothetical protein
MRDFAGQAFGELWQRDPCSSESKRSTGVKLLDADRSLGFAFIFEKINI